MHQIQRVCSRAIIIICLYYILYIFVLIANNNIIWRGSKCMSESDDIKLKHPSILTLVNLVKSLGAPKAYRMSTRNKEQEIEAEVKGNEHLYCYLWDNTQILLAAIVVWPLTTWHQINEVKADSHSNAQGRTFPVWSVNISKYLCELSPQCLCGKCSRKAKSENHTQAWICRMRSRAVMSGNSRDIVTINPHISQLFRECVKIHWWYSQIDQDSVFR